MRNLERAEDIARRGDGRGHRLDVDDVPGVPRRRRRAAQGHQLRGLRRPLRAAHVRRWASAPSSKAATEDDLRAMERELRDGAHARAPWASRPRGRPATRRRTAGRWRAALANWDEVRRLVGVMGEMNAGIFEIAGERFDDPTTGPARLPRAAARPRRGDGAAHHVGPLQPPRGARRSGATYIDAARGNGRAGGRMFAQVHSRALTVVLSFKTNLPFDRLPVWKELRALPLEEQKRRLRDPELRRHAWWPPRASATSARPIGAEARAGVLRLDLRHGHARRAPPVGRRRRAGARLRSRRGHDRSRARAGPRPLLPPAHRQRGPGPRARADQAPAHGGDVLGLRRARLADHGRLAADASARPLGAGQAGAHARAGRADAVLRQRHALGLRGPRAHPRGLCRRPRRLRSRHRRSGDAGSGARPARGGAPPRSAVAGHSRPRSSTARPCCATASTRARCPAACCGGRSPESSLDAYLAPHTSREVCGAVPT